MTGFYKASYAGMMGKHKSSLFGNRSQELRIVFNSTNINKWIFHKQECFIYLFI
ncbi:MAG: hypothetical protein N2319_13355 [Candidatus Kapabacteria bacterium]|nr:hypothetical protein [Candidatus Kapabacteria bacterium]